MESVELEVEASGLDIVVGFILESDRRSIKGGGFKLLIRRNSALGEGGICFGACGLLLPHKLLKLQLDLSVVSAGLVVSIAGDVMRRDEEPTGDGLYDFRNCSSPL